MLPHSRLFLFFIDICGFLASSQSIIQHPLTCYTMNEMMVRGYDCNSRPRMGKRREFPRRPAESSSLPLKWFDDIWWHDVLIRAPSELDSKLLHEQKFAAISLPGYSMPSMPTTAPSKPPTAPIHESLEASGSLLRSSWMQVASSYMIQSSSSLRHLYRCKDL